MVVRTITIDKDGNDITEAVKAAKREARDKSAEQERLAELRFAGRMKLAEMKHAGKKELAELKQAERLKLAELRLAEQQKRTEEAKAKLEEEKAKQEAGVANSRNDILLGIETPTAERYRDVLSQLVVDQGGFDRMSEARLQLCSRFAAAAVIAEQMEARFVKGEQIDIGEHSVLSSTMVRIAARIGIDRRARMIPVLGDYIETVDAAKASLRDDPARNEPRVGDVEDEPPPLVGDDILGPEEEDDLGDAEEDLGDDDDDDDFDNEAYAAKGGTP